MRKGCEGLTVTFSRTLSAKRFCLRSACAGNCDRLPAAPCVEGRNLRLCDLKGVCRDTLPRTSAEITAIFQGSLKSGYPDRFFRIFFQLLFQQRRRHASSNWRAAASHHSRKLSSAIRISHGCRSGFSRRRFAARPAAAPRDLSNEPRIPPDGGQDRILSRDSEFPSLCSPAP